MAWKNRSLAAVGGRDETERAFYGPRVAEKIRRAENGLDLWTGLPSEEAELAIQPEPGEKICEVCQLIFLPTTRGARRCSGCRWTGNRLIKR